MAVATSCSIVTNKDPVLLPTKRILTGDKLLASRIFSNGKIPQHSVVSNDRRFGRRWNAEQQSMKKERNYINALHSAARNRSTSTLAEAPSFMICGTGRKIHFSGFISQKKILSFRCDASLSRNNGGQLKALDVYFSRLEEKMIGQEASRIGKIDFNITTGEECSQSSSDFETQKIKNGTRNDKLKAGVELDSLEDYFIKLKPGTQSQRGNSETFRKDYRETSPTMSSNILADGYRGNDQKMAENLGNLHMSSKADDSLVSEETDAEASDLYLINFLVSINVAVFLFEIATPVGNLNHQQLSIPLIYGAKINKLILEGEWWRLITPMFLHYGFLDVVFSSWTLLNLGPQVSRAYGRVTFFLIFILGGICANLTSFAHTSELAVCGTGPVFAIIGAWLIYEIQNRETIGPEVSNKMFQKAILATTMGFLLSCTGQIDEWTHLGAVASGVFYGFLTSPIMQLDMSPEESQKEGIALVRQQADTCRSILTFFVFVLTLCSLAYMFDQELELDSFF